MTDKKIEAKKEDRRVKRTKKSLRDSLFKLLEEKNINQITVTELTKCADVNRSTFYLYYTDVFDMMEKIQAEIYDVFVTTVVEKKYDAEDPDAIISYCAGFLDFCKDNYNVCRFITRNDCNNQLCDNIKLAVRRIIPDSAYGFDELDPRHYMTTFALSGMLTTILEWMEDGMRIPSQDMAKFLIYTYVFGSLKQKVGDMYKDYTHVTGND